MKNLFLLCITLFAVFVSAARGQQEIVLFDGTGITGWDQSGPGSFELKDGVLTSQGGMGMLWHEKEFSDFILKLQFKVEHEQDNSGVFVRFPNPGDTPGVAIKQGHEIQICGKDGKNPTGAIYGFKPPTESPIKPPGEWNDYEIKVVGPQYTVTLNGKQINEFTSDRRRSGHIGIQNHDDASRISFRDIRITDLTVAPAAAPSPPPEPSPAPAPAPAPAEAPAPPPAEAPAPAPSETPAPPPPAAPAPAPPETPAPPPPEAPAPASPETPAPPPPEAPAPAPAETPAAPPAEVPAPPPVEAPPEAPATAPAQAPATAQDLKPGLIGQYYKAKDFSAPELEQPPFFVRVDPEIRFWARNGQFYRTKLARDFVVRWSGVIRVEHPGTYTFIVRSDDDSRIVISDQLLIDNEKPESMKEKSAPIGLGPGDHPIRIDFRNSSGPAGMVLSWKRDDGEEEGVPASAFYHNPKDADAIAWNKDAWRQERFYRKEWARQYGDIHDKMDYGPYLSSTLPIGPQNTALKGIAVRLNQNEDAGIAFDTELLRWAGGWTGGFLHLEGVAFNGSHGLSPAPDGEMVFATKQQPGAWSGDSETAPPDPRSKPFGPLPRDWGRYRGLYLYGDQVLIAYTLGKREVLELPRLEQIDGKQALTRTMQIAPGDHALTFVLRDVDDTQRNLLHVPSNTEWTTYRIEYRAGEEPKTTGPFGGEDLSALCKGGSLRWTQPIQTKGELGAGEGAYVVDTLAVPEDNLYSSWMRFGGLDFFADGRAALCTWNGDVWIVSGLDDKLEKLTWKRYATGLNQTLGLKIVDDKVYTLGRDQITRLHDLNSDGEADFYENFNNECQVSDSFHEFAMDLQTDSQGNFYYAKGGPVRPGGRGWETITDHNGTVIKVSKDGSQFEVFATGVRAPNGMGIGPNDEISIGDNEGTWTPTCRLSLVKKGDFLGVVDLARRDPPPTDYQKPLCWLSKAEVDNSSGAQVWVTNDTWGPFTGEMLHLSYGQCALFKVLKEEVDGQVQGGVVKFPLQFLTGICRARFHPIDKQLYVTGLRGWQTSAAKDGALQRIRYTGKPVRMPTALRVKSNGIEIVFTDPLNREMAANVDNYAIEQWNYIWSSEYGSPEVSVQDPTIKEHDPVDIESATVSDDGKTVLLKVPDIKPVMQMKIEFKLQAADGAPVEHTIFNTINKVPPVEGAVTHAPSQGQ